MRGQDTRAGYAGIVFRRLAQGHKKIIYAYPGFLFHGPGAT